VDLDEVLYGGDGIEDDLHSILFNSVALTFSKWWTIKFLRWVQPLNRLVDLDEILYGGDGIEYYLNYIPFNSVPSTISKWWTLNF
jgi:hypothetical protein